RGRDTSRQLGNRRSGARRGRMDWRPTEEREYHALKYARSGQFLCHSNRSDEISCRRVSKSTPPFTTIMMARAELPARWNQLLRAATTVQTARPVARAVFATLPAPRRLTNRKILCAQRSLFAIPRDRGQGVRQQHCDRFRVRQDRDRASWAASRSAT